MSDIITSVLTDPAARSSAAVEDLALKQAVADPWLDETA
jgi:hypothetical protein